MTDDEFLTRLLRLAHLPARRGNVMTGDALYEDEFRDLQSELLQLIEDVVNQMPGGAERVTRELPGVFLEREKTP